MPTVTPTELTDNDGIVSVKSGDLHISDDRLNCDKAEDGVGDKWLYCRSTVIKVKAAKEQNTNRSTVEIEN